MKISEIITDKYKLRIPPTVYYELLADVQELEEEQEPTTKNDLGVDCICRTSALDSINWAYNLSDAYQKINDLPSVTPQEPILDKLRAEITTLQNRCYALTRGTMCAFCKYVCKYKAETEAADDK